MIAEAARGAFGPADVEAEVKLKQRRERIRKQIEDAKVAARAAEGKENSSATGIAGWFSSNKESKQETKKVNYAAAQKAGAAAIEKRQTAAKAAAMGAADAQKADEPTAAAPAATAGTAEGDAKQGAALFKADRKSVV